MLAHCCIINLGVGEAIQQLPSPGNVHFKQHSISVSSAKAFTVLFFVFFQVVQDILEHEREFVKELQTVLSCYLRPLQASDK